MSSTAPERKPLGVRVSPEEHAIIRRAAEREHRSINNFVLRAALKAAQEDQPKPRKSREEVLAIIHDAQQEVRSANPNGRDILQELFDERRKEAARG
ncbi:MAG: DUF1778 domain-containing protein [Acidobacteriota bacterium]|nr:DUF1778 domain-containing protein [Acidobacteriota bacterium]